MYNLIVGICHVALRLRHVTSLKEKRNILVSASDRLRAMGFSVVECGDRGNIRELHMGLSLVGPTANRVNKTLDSAANLFRREFEVLQIDRDVFDYEPSENDDLSWMISPEDDVKD